MISVLLVDDHPVVLRGLQELFTAQGDFRVAGVETGAARVVRKTKLLKPDVAILDLMMPDLNGMDLIRQVATQCPDTRIVVLSMHANPAYVCMALHNGALGYVLKCADAELLIHAVREAVEGRRYLSPPLSESDMEEYASAIRQAPFDPYEMLTNREKQILHMAAQGHSSAQISAKLNISVRTVETHRAHFLRKLNLHGQTELVRYAIQRGIVSSDWPAS